MGKSSILIPVLVLIGCAPVWGRGYPPALADQHMRLPEGSVSRSSPVSRIFASRWRSHPASVTLLASNELRTSVPRADIRENRESAISLIPEELITKMTPGDLRALFAYLQSDGPPVRRTVRAGR